MGLNKDQKHPPVLQLAQCANSKPQKGRNTFQDHILNHKTTLRRGELLGIGRPIWLKVQESESRVSLIENMISRENVEIRSKIYRGREENLNGTHATKAQG